MAQAIRASLLASAMAAILVGRRANSAVSQGRCLVPWILARLRDLGGACGLAQANGHRRIRVAGNGDRNWRRNASGRSARMAQPPSGPLGARSWGVT